MAPDLRAFIAGTAARATRKIPFRSISNVRSHLSSSSVSSGALWAIPALATTTSIRPRRASTLATSASTADVERTSSAWNSAEPPAIRMASTVSLPSRSSTSVTTTWSPSAAKALAVACPMPMPAPVMRTTREESSVSVMIVMSSLTASRRRNSDRASVRQTGWPAATQERQRLPPPPQARRNGQAAARMPCGCAIPATVPEQAVC